MQADEAARLLPTVRKCADGALQVDVMNHPQAETQYIRITFSTGFIFLHSVKEVVRALRHWTHKEPQAW